MSLNSALPVILLLLISGLSSAAEKTSVQLPYTGNGIVFNFLRELSSEWRSDFDIILHLDEFEASKTTNTSFVFRQELSKKCIGCIVSVVESNGAGFNLMPRTSNQSQRNAIDIFTAMDHNTFDEFKILELDKKTNSISAQSYIFIIALPFSDVNAIRVLKSKIQEVLRSSAANLEQELGLNSNLYILAIGQHSMIESQSWSLYEFYVLNGAVLINPVRLESFGNKVATRSNFHGIPIRATAPEGSMTQGEIIWKFDPTTKSPFLSHGFGVDIFKCVQQALNFSLVSVPTKGWATQFPGNCSWDVGMAQEVTLGRADIALAKTSILTNRAASLSYLVPIHALTLTAFFRQPSASTVRNILLLPFEPPLWIGLAVTWILLLVTMKLITVLRFRFVVLAHPVFDSEEEMESAIVETEIWSRNNLWCFGAVCQQGSYLTPKVLQLKIVMLLGLFLGLLSFVAYSAAMVSFFTVTTNSINSFEQLLRSPLQITIDMQNAVAGMLTKRIARTENGTLTHTYTSVATLLIQKVAAGGNSSYLMVPEGQARLLTRPVAHLTFPDKFYTTIKEKHSATASDAYLCSEISSFPVTSVPFRSGLFVAKGSPYKEHFNAKILVVFTSGLMRRYVAAYEATYTPICAFGMRKLYTGAEVSDLFSAYMVLTMGAAAAGGLLLVEKISISIRMCSRMIKM